MATHRFDLVTEWHLDDPIKSVWLLLTEIENWPQWWRAVKRVELLQPGAANGLGAVPPDDVEDGVALSADL